MRASGRRERSWGEGRPLATTEGSQKLEAHGDDAHPPNIMRLTPQIFNVVLSTHGKYQLHRVEALPLVAAL